MAAKKPMSVHEALGGRQQPRRPRPTRALRAAQAEREDFLALGWAIEYAQRQQALLWLGHSLAGFGDARTVSEPQLRHCCEGWDAW
jgi:hypothetical protein